MSTKKAATTQTATRGAGSVGRLHDESNGTNVVDPKAESDLPEAGKDACQTPRRPSLSPTEGQPFQPSKKGTGNKEDWPRDGKRTSTSTYNQTDPTDTSTISRAT